MNRCIKLLSATLLVAFVTACTQSGEKKVYDTPTTGSIEIIADETLEPVVDAEQYTFESIYKYAKLKTRYLPEKEAINALINDTARLAVLTRDLTNEERSYFDKIKIRIRTTPVANDAIAVIINPANTDTAFTTTQISDILSGKITDWQQLGKKSSGKIALVFDNKYSSTLRYLCDKAGIKELTSANVFAVNNNKAVIDYVSTNKNAIGVIGMNWISDGDDVLSAQLIDKIKVAAIAESAEKGYYKPYQAYVALKKYPYVRQVLIVSREARAGLGTGFASFVSSDRGQRIIMKSGLVAETVPVRIIQFPENKDSDPSTDFADE